MTEKQLRNLVRTWQESLGLERWKIEVDLAKSANTENVAETAPHSLYDTATIRFDPEWSTWTPEYAQATVIHELLHLLHRDTDQAFYDVEGQLQRDAWTMADRRYNHAMEGFIERLASRICELQCA